VSPSFLSHLVPANIIVVVCNYVETPTFEKTFCQQGRKREREKEGGGRKKRWRSGDKAVQEVCHLEVFEPPGHDKGKQPKSTFSACHHTTKSTILTRAIIYQHQVSGGDDESTCKESFDIEIRQIVGAMRSLDVRFTINKLT
jgi:hypothetical protein